MATEGKIRASDLLDEKALIIFRELEQITEDNIKAIEKLKETNQRLHKTTMKNSSEQIAVTQEIKKNLMSIDALRKEMIQTELAAVGAAASAEAKRKSIYNAEMKRIKDRLAAHEKVTEQEKRDIEEIKAARLASFKAEDNKGKDTYDRWRAWRDKKRATEKKDTAARRSAFKKTITAMSTGYLALEQIYNRVAAGFTKLVDKLKVLDNFSNLMERLTGTASAAAETMEYLIDISRRFGLSLQVATERYSKFFAAAKQANLSLEDTQKIFTSVAKVSGILGLASHELSGVFLALEQMLSKGKVTTEELRRQLGERLPGAFGIMAKAVDVLNPEMVITVENLDELLKKGEIISAEVLPEFARQLEIAFNAMDVVKVETLAAAQSEFGTAVTQLLYIMENGQGTVSNFFRGFYDGLTSNIDAIAEWIQLLDATDEQLQELEKLQTSKRLEQLFDFMDFTDFAENPWRGAAEAVDDYKKEIIDAQKEAMIHKLLVQDVTTAQYQNGLETRKLGELAEEQKIVDELILKNKELTTDELRVQLKLLQDQKMEMREIEGMEGGSIEWLDFYIKKFKDQLTAEGTSANYDSKKMVSLREQLKLYQKIRKELAIRLGLEDPSKKGGDGFKDDTVTTKELELLSPDSIIDVQQRLKFVQDQLNNLSDTEVLRRDILQDQADQLEFQLAHLKDIKKSIDDIVEVIEPEELGIDDYIGSFADRFNVAINKFGGGQGLFMPGRDKLEDKFKSQYTGPLGDDKESQKKYEEEYKKFIQREEELAQATLQYGIEMTNQLFEIGNAIFARRIEQIQAEMDATERYYDRRMLLAQGDAEQEKELQMQKARDMEILRRKELKERQKMAKFEKAQAITNAIINTAVAITAMGQAGPIGIPLMALMIAVGAAQVATIVAQPIPQYKDGREGGPEELAIVGDGGRSEYIAGKDGSIVKTPNVPTLAYLKKGDDVLKDDRALQHMISQTLLKDHNITLNQEAGDIEDAVIAGFKKAKVNNYIKMPKIKVDIDKAMWLNKNHQF